MAGGVTAPPIRAKRWGMGSNPPPFDREAVMERIRRGFILGVPHQAELGLRLLDFAPGTVVLELPYHDRLVGNPETGVLHGGVITTLIDSACGGAVIGALWKPTRVATLDLRIDYLRPAEPGRDVRCVATCFKVTHNIAFVRATADHGEGSDAIAAAAGTFAIIRDAERGADKIVGMG